MFIPRWIRRREPKLVPISPAVWQFPKTFECLTLTPPPPPKCPPCVSRGNLFGVYIRSQVDLQMCVTFGANRSSRLTASPDFWICDTLTLPEMPPGVLRGDLYLAYVHSQMNPQTWTKGGANRTAFADLNCWPPKPPKCAPCVSRGIFFGVYPFPYEFAHVCQIWCQSAQPFGSFSRICAKVSSAFRRCTR